MSAFNAQQCDSFLSLVPEQHRRTILERSVHRKYKKGDQIVRVLDTDHNVYIVNSGMVRVTLFSREGKEVSFVDIKKGENFGELSAIDKRPRSANVIALSDTEITIISPDVFLGLLKKYPGVGIEILKQIAGVVRRLCDRIFEYSTMDVRNRICVEILRLAKQNVDLDGIARIHNPPTQLEMASRIGCAREAVSREFSNLDKAGIVTRSARRLIVKDLNRLKDVSDNKIEI